MCGIAGYFGHPDPSIPRRATVARMVGAIAHRGPDDRGVFVDDNVGLGHARLSIIDVASGAQPMANADGTVHVAFNGEIFNYVELRADLIARGHRFRTESDTEVILHAYEAWGIDCVEAFNGDFAFALWDSRLKRFVAARDRMGVRPFFYAWRDGCLYFASEVKALLEVPGIDAELDPLALDQIFTVWFPIAPRTLFKGVMELPAGHRLIATPDTVNVAPWWRLSFPDAGDSAAHDNRDEHEIADELRFLLLDATRIRLRSDVPVGAYLSGGLDSSIVAAAVHRIQPDRLRTFSVTFEQEEYDESAWQATMVDALGTDHTAVACRSADIGASFPTVVRHVEQPLLRTGPAPMLALSQLAHDQGYKVVLTGEGADEVFGGYDTFKEAAVRRFCARQPGSERRPRLFERLYPYLPGLKRQTGQYRRAFFSAGPEDTTDPLFSHMPRFRTAIGAKIFYSDDMRATLAGYDALADLGAGLPADFGRWHPLHQAQYLETVYLLPGYILSSQGDRVAMANAVEGRFPFLDHRVVTFASRLPPHLKLRGLREKRILRRAMGPLLPPTAAARPKQPYRAPIAQAFVGGGAPDYVGDALSVAAIRHSGHFDPHAVDRLLAKARSRRLAGFRDNSALVGILSTQLWQRQFTRHAGTADDIPAVA